MFRALFEKLALISRKRGFILTTSDPLSWNSISLRLYKTLSKVPFKQPLPVLTQNNCQLSFEILLITSGLLIP